LPLHLRFLSFFRLQALQIGPLRMPFPPSQGRLSEGFTFSVKTGGEKSMMLDWNDYKNQLTGRIGELSKLSPDTVKGYMTLSGANVQTTHLGEKTRQLISLAVAVTTRCDGCITFHTDAALKAGASKDEISEALGVAVAMNAGAALVYSTRVLDAVEAKSATAAAK
jgi:AhpD family alkylhydroperoxidase